jgi:4-amino-4-deoxy-L-arabinose transferase-like glycosyltransferase
LLAVALGSLLLNLVGLGASPLWDQDETKYAQVAREILWTGDWLTLHWNGQPWFVHPPLYFWLVAATAKVLGLTEFTARVWSALFGAGAVLLTGLLAQGWFSARAGWLAALVLATTLQWFAQSRLAVFDSVLVFWMLGTLLGFSAGIRGSRGGYLWAFACAGLGTLTKGPVAALVPGLAALVYLAWRRELGKLRQVPWVAGLAVYTVLGLGWYAAGFLRHGRPFVDSVLGYYTVNRFVGVVENQAGPVWYYVPVLLLGGLPWNSFWVLWPRLLRGGAEVMPAVWCAVVFAFFSAAQTKLPNYVLSFYPLAAVATGAALDAFWERPWDLRPGFWGLGAVWLVFCAAVAAYGLWLYPTEARALWAVLAVPLGVLGAGLLGAALLGSRGGTAAAVKALAAGAVLFFLSLVWWVLPEVDRYRPHREVGAAAAAWTGGEELRVAYRIPNSLVFYSRRTWRAYLDPEPVRRELCGAGRARAVLLAPADAAGDLGPLVGQLRRLQELRGWVLLEKPQGQVLRCPSR